MKFYLALFALIALTLLVNVECKPAGDSERTCQPRGGYCQNHWDCCSNSCLSFSYKCVGDDAQGPYQPPVFYPPPINTLPEETMTLDELIKDVFGDQN